MDREVNTVDIGERLLGFFFILHMWQIVSKLTKNQFKYLNIVRKLG